MTEKGSVSVYIQIHFLLSDSKSMDKLFGRMNIQLYRMDHIFRA